LIRSGWILGLIAAGLATAHVGPLLFNHSEQDSCSFGNVSNSEYKLLLSKASLGFWRPFVWNDDAVSAQLNAKYRELVVGESGIDAKVAAAHAVLRALGGELRRFDDLHTPNKDAKIRRAFVYRYLLDINQLFYFAPIFRQMMVTVVFNNPFSPGSNETDGGVRPIIAHLPNASEGFYHFDQNAGGDGCPPIPEK
jgi:hypothetical protein